MRAGLGKGIPNDLPNDCSSEKAEASVKERQFNQHNNKGGMIGGHERQDTKCTFSSVAPLLSLSAIQLVREKPVRLKIKPADNNQRK